MRVVASGHACAAWVHVRVPARRLAGLLLLFLRVLAVRSPHDRGTDAQRSSQPSDALTFVSMQESTPLPLLFCWTRFGTEAGEPIEAILERKEREREATGGV